MSLTFDAATHVYRLDDAVVPSVTQILKASGLIDFSRFTEQARVRGSIVHEAIAAKNEGDLDEAAFRHDFAEYEGWFDAWLAFCSQRAFVPLLCEHRIASRRYQVAGTLDVIGTLDGEPALIDYATGHPLTVSKDYQLAGYLALAREWSQEPEADPRLRDAVGLVTKRYALALRGDGTFTLHPYPDPADFRKFFALVEAHRIVTARRGQIEVT